MRNKINFCLIVFAMLSSLAMAQESQNPVAMQGKEGIYLFMSNSIPGANNPENIRRIIIEKSTRATGKFQQVAVVERAANPEAFKQIAGSSALETLADAMELSDENGAWQYILEHQNLDEYGWFPLDLKFSEAVGVVWVDRTQYGSRTQQMHYRISFVGDNNTTQRSHNVTATFKNRIETNQQLSFHRMERDSMVQIMWQAPALKDDETFWAEVYRKRADEERYQKLSSLIMANFTERADTIQFNLIDAVVPGHRYSYFLLPTNIAGLPGQASDTVHALSIDFEKQALIENFEARDTIGGIFLAWDKLPEDAFYTGIIIERTSDPEGEYLAIDTVDARSQNYLDQQLRPALVYYYRLRLIDVRMRSTPPQAWASQAYKGSEDIPRAPYSVKVTPVDDNLRISWSKDEDPKVMGYYLLRRVNEKDEWETVSPLLEDTMYVDTYDQLDSRIMYHYAVQAVSINDQISLPSTTSFGRPERKMKLPYPEGLVAASEPGSLSLKWQNMSGFDDYISGYKVYKKRIQGTQSQPDTISASALSNEGFRNIAVLDAETSYVEHEPEAGTWLYAVSSIDMRGNESPVSIVRVSIEAMKLSPPSTFGLRNIPEGVEISWNFRGLEDVEVIIYRRSMGQQATQIGKVNQERNQFIDTGAQAGNLYQYTLRLERSGTQSEMSLEKSVRR